MVDDRIDLRLPSIKVVDVILASLQAAFGQERLFNDVANPYRFVRDNPSGSRVWVCTPEERVGERDGKRMIVTVTRGEYNPQELHLLNRTDGGFGRPIRNTDLASAPIYIQCEAGTQVQSEVLASICYSVIKLFRQDLMAEYDIHSLKMNGISAAVKQKGVPGEPWVTMVSMKVEMQEICTITELGNSLNMTVIRGELDKNKTRLVVALDSTIQ